MLGRHTAAAALRRAGLLNVGYHAVYRADLLRNRSANRRFAREHPELRIPPPAMIFETGATTSSEIFYAGGRERASFIIGLAGEQLGDGPLRICEWGCGPGRVVRHLGAIEPAREVVVTGTDLSLSSIGWCAANLPGIAFEVNGLEPPLPFADEAFDLLYSFSVMTHLPPELQQDWLAENLRVVRPGGVVLFTVHGDSYRSRLLSGEIERYDAEGVVVRAGVDEGSPWFNTYQQPDHVRRTLVGELRVAYEELHGTASPQAQDVWAVVKPG